MDQNCWVYLWNRHGQLITILPLKKIWGSPSCLDLLKTFMPSWGIFRVGCLIWWMSLGGSKRVPILSSTEPYPIYLELACRVYHYVRCSKYFVIHQINAKPCHLRWKVCHLLGRWMLGIWTFGCLIRIDDDSPSFCKLNMRWAGRLRANLLTQMGF